MDPQSLFLIATPGLESQVLAEARAAGFEAAAEPGGIAIAGGWADAARANLALRTPTRVLARIATFRAMHPAQLDKRARKIDWVSLLRANVPVRVDAVCRKSRIYHDKAAQSRVEDAITASGIPLGDDGIRVMVRIHDDLCTVSVDTSGEPLHRRGHKLAVNKAPMRETMAAAFLRAAGYEGTEPVVDPMCGSGTFPIEAAEMAAGLLPGRSRDFAYRRLAVFDPAWDEVACRPEPIGSPRFFGSDRDASAIRMAMANAERAGVGHACAFHHAAISDATPPDGPPGLVVVNPPYGGRVGKGPLYGLYATFGQIMRERFAGWRVALVTSQDGLAKAAGLPWDRPGPIVDHGGTKVRLWQATL
ncbi:class I SAM-dependent RNA methyltransferase [Jannaschia sp. LMIT008]|uniref:THUMP domain-containing class I SAM-dependent RNA methyltransferase n=1 Tax=Jannaschia maritima TaxID=3032585 RepID=UPI002810A30C|nr:class I SAM-dependent RNA methyltransferase [Jannaschia sp. LMIT008]